MMEKSGRIIGVGDGNDNLVAGIIKQVPLSLDDSFNVIVDLLVTKANSYDMLFGKNIIKTL